MLEKKEYEYSRKYLYKNRKKQIDKGLLQIEPNKEVFEKIEQYNKEGYLTAIVHLTGDLMHAGHIAYIQAIRKKIQDKFGIKDEDIKLFVGLEDEERTVRRKGKRPIYDNEERLYQWSHLKGVDEVFIYNVPDGFHPSDICCYYNVDVFVGHEEHFDFNKYLRTAKKLRRMNLKTKTLIIRNLDIVKYLGRDIRAEKNISTTNIVKRIVKNQRNLVLKILKENE